MTHRLYILHLNLFKALDVSKDRIKVLGEPRHPLVFNTKKRERSNL